MAGALRYVTIARDDDIYEAFPDICQLPTGKLLCIYRESDVHVASTSRTMLIESHDRGRTWINKRPFDVRRSFAEDRSVWKRPPHRPVTRRAARGELRRIRVPDEAGDWNWPHHRTCYQTSLWFSEDEGQTWSERRSTEIEGNARTSCAC